MSGFTAGQTIRVRGEGGSVYDQDVPADVARRELLEEFIATAKLEVLGVVVDQDLFPAKQMEDGKQTLAGRLVPLDELAVVAPDPPVDPGGDVDPDEEPIGEVPEGTIEEILTWVDNDVERARAAFVAEQNGKQRATLIAALAETLER